MKKQKEKTPIRKNRKIRYSFSISEDVIGKLNDKIGYGSRSKVIESIISQFLDNKNKFGSKRAKQDEFMEYGRNHSQKCTNNEVERP